MPSAHLYTTIDIPQHALSTSPRPPEHDHIRRHNKIEHPVSIWEYEQFAQLGLLASKASAQSFLPKCEVKATGTGW